MPMTPELRRSIDRIREYHFGGGYPNPSQNAEQLSFMILCRTPGYAARRLGAGA